MNLKGLRLTIIILVLALTLASLFGAQWLYRRQALDRPLAEGVGSVPGVLETISRHHGDTLQVKVRLADTPRIESLVSELWRAIDTVEGDRPVELLISDSRSPELEDLYYGFHFFLQEAVATGRYSELPAQLAEIAPPGVADRARVYVAPDYVYVQLHRDGASLYEIVPRGSDGGASPAEAGRTASRLVTVGPWGG